MVASKVRNMVAFSLLLNEWSLALSLTLLHGHSKHKLQLLSTTRYCSPCHANKEQQEVSRDHSRHLPTMFEQSKTKLIKSVKIVFATFEKLPWGSALVWAMRRKEGRME